MSRDCPSCGSDLVPFGELTESLRRELESDESRQQQSREHRLSNHFVCPSCSFEQHGCGQPYVIPERESNFP